MTIYGEFITVLYLSIMAFGILLNVVEQPTLRFGLFILMILNILWQSFVYHSIATASLRGKK